MKMTESLTTIKEKVEKILKEFPKTRDSDKLLWIAYMVIYHDLKHVLGEKSYQYFKMMLLDENVPTMESVRRVRQKLQESGNYIGSCRETRLIESNSVKAWSIK